MPAKLSAPRTAGVVPRERLFAWLDAQRGAVAALWLAGAPGAGKTMLAASYLRSRALPHLWLRLDGDDNDIGRFFATLGQAADSLATTDLKRPAFGAEHLGQPLAYARAWFRAVLPALPRPLAIVLDNVEQAPLPLLAELLGQAIAEAPDGVTLIVTCRERPPAALAGALVAGKLAVLPPGQLDFTADEAALYARMLSLDEAVVARAALRVGGWAAGLRLLSHAGGSAAAHDPGDAGDPSASQRLLFDHLAGLLHDSLDAPGQRLLLVAALLPWVPAGLAGRVADVADAAARLDALCARHLFVERAETTSAAAGAVYRLHPLLREFLRERARTALDADARRALLRAAAHEFAAQGEVDSSIDLLLDAEQFDAAAQRLRAVLEDKLALGQIGQWQAWVARLPAALADADAHLQNTDSFIGHRRFATQMHTWHELQSGRAATARAHAQALRAAIEHSDMPLRIRTLGRFTVEADGVPLRFDGGKAPRRPLALLKALIALGPHPVPEHALADSLWPDADADAAHDALGVALHRLRKLLPHGAEALRLHDGRLSLDADRVWVDCRAFEQLVADSDPATGGAGAVRIALLQDALALYQGYFLAGDDDEPWAVAARERLRSRFGRAVNACASALSDAGRADEALACYKRGIETDDLDEALYQGVMRCALRLRRPAEGIAAYRRCRRMLELSLGVLPSGETESLLRRLQAI